MASSRPTELSDIAELGPLQTVEAELAELLAEDDVEHLAAAMEPGSTAGVLDLGEPVGRAVRVGRAPFRRPAHRQRAHPHPGDHRLHRGRRQQQRPKETDMPLRPARVGRVGVIGHPVAKTAVVAEPSRRVAAPVAKNRRRRGRGDAGATPPAHLNLGRSRRIGRQDRCR